VLNVFQLNVHLDAPKRPLAKLLGHGFIV
jgi:hypothetical protein